MSLAMSVVGVLQALSRVTAMLAASIGRMLKAVRQLAVPRVMPAAGLLCVMLQVMGPVLTLTTVRVLRCIGVVTGCVAGEGVVGGGKCGDVAGEAPADCETVDADGGGAAGGVTGVGEARDVDGECAGMGDAGDMRAAEGGRCG